MNPKIVLPCYIISVIAAFVFGVTIASSLYWIPKCRALIETSSVYGPSHDR